MDIPGLFIDGHGYSGIHGYSDKGGRVDIPGLSMDGHSYSGIRGFSDMGGRVDILGLSMDGHCYSGIRGYSDKGGGEGWTFVDYPGMVTVTPAYGDTLTWRGRVDIHGLSMDGHSYSGIRGYSDKVGGGGGGGGEGWTSMDYPGMVTVTPS